MGDSTWLGDMQAGAAKGAGIGAIAGTVVPGIGNAVGGIAGGAIGGLVGLAQNLFPETLGGVLAGSRASEAVPIIAAAVEKITGASEPGGAAFVLSESPEKRAELQQELVVNLAEIKRLENEDRANARAREITIGDYTPRILAYIAVVGTFAIMIMLMFIEVPAGNERLFDMLLGVLVSVGFSGAYQFFLGSSAGSGVKTRLLANERTKN